MDQTQKVILLTVSGLLLVGVVLLFTLGGGSGTSKQVAGLNEGAPPWQPDYANLRQRIGELGLPPPGKETFHQHALLKVYADGQEIPVPANIAFNPSQGVAAALHTHDASGVVHLEADQPFTARLGDFFTLWGVRFTADQLGSYKNATDKTIQVFVNGQPVSDPAGYAIKAKDKIVVGYGAAGSFPTTISAELPPGL